MNPHSIPLATYRLQFNQNFTFAQAAELVPYLAALGISHCYASPYLRARPGSTHGYDIIDHNMLNPEIGSAEDYDRFVNALHEHGMGQILDIVPNHMGVMGSDNAWWLDVLENGEASSYAEFFDIDWEPLKDELQHKVLVPVLGDQYGTVLDNGELALKFDKEKGEFSIWYHQHRFPVNPREYSRILSYDVPRLEQKLGPQNEDLLELQSITAAFGHLPERQDAIAEKRAERNRDKEINKRRLSALCMRSAEIASFIEENVTRFNGVVGQAESFGNLHELIKAQAYRLAYWRVAADDINYRRFFDVNDLAGLCQENPAVFEETHRLILELLRTGKVNGLRVDHPDGLYNPAEYFRRLQESQGFRGEGGGRDCQSSYIIIEKILTGDEQLPMDWPVCGTTGYDFANLVNALFVDKSSEAKMDRLYRVFVGRQAEFDDLVYDCKKLVMDRALASELNVLANILTRIALANRHTCDFTTKTLRDALAEVVACFPVYRTYVTGDHLSSTDRGYIEEAIRCAKDKSTSADSSVYDFVEAVLLTTLAEGDTRKFYRAAVVNFAMKFQQFTSALMAKGVEDTAFYRYNRLVSLNEVGGDPRRFGVSVDEFHRRTQERATAWPHSLLATSTHDTKRSEDVRARINVLSEIPLQWRRQVRWWQQLNRNKKQIIRGVEAPSSNDEYLLYQTLMGTWPLSDEEWGGDAFRKRIHGYMLKAVREAKSRSSWANPSPKYEAALGKFIEEVMTPAERNEFLAEFVPFQRQVAQFGMLNSLSQTVLKLTSPGVPDVYQGNEIWEFSLVDPDNRRALNYSWRQALLAEMRDAASGCCAQLRSLVRKLVEDMTDGRIKMYVTWKILQLRKRHADFFCEGDYIPLTVTGEKAEHLVAFARKTHGALAVVVVPRFCARLISEPSRALHEEALWQDTRVQLPAEALSSALRNVFTGERVTGDKEGQICTLRPAVLFADFPVALCVPEALAT